MATEVETRRSALAFASASFAVAAPVAYVVQRLVEVSRASVAFDPTLVVSDLHTAFYWRAATATWWGGIVAIAVHAWASRSPSLDRPARRLALAAVPIAISIAILAWRFP